MTAKDNPQGTFHDAVTGETYSRDLTPEEIEVLPKANDETPTAD